MIRKFKVITNLKTSAAIYKIYCRESDKIYIGESVNVSNRIQKHFSFLRKNKHTNPILQNLFNKYGEESFIVDIIEYCNNSDKLYLRNKEKEYQMLEPNCISMDSNDYIIKNRSEESYSNSIKALHEFREKSLENWRTPVIVYNVNDKSYKHYKQLDDILSFFESKHAYKNLKDKILIPYNGMVCFYPNEFNDENIKKIIQAKTNSYITNRGDYRLYDLITSNVLYFSNKTQFSLYFSNSRNDKLYDMYENLIDENFLTTKNINSYEELSKMDFIFSRTKTNIKKINILTYYDILKSHKTLIDSSSKLGITRKLLSDLFKRKSINDRISEVENLIARIKSI